MKRTETSPSATLSKINPKYSDMGQNTDSRCEQVWYRKLLLLLGCVVTFCENLLLMFTLIFFFVLNMPITISNVLPRTKVLLFLTYNNTSYTACRYLYSLHTPTYEQ